MLCCGHTLTRREWMWATALSSLGSMASATSAAARAETPAALASPTPAEKLLRDNISIDVHTHAGPNGISSRTARPGGEIAQGMQTGGIAVLCLADVPDGPILGRNAQNVLTV